MNKTEPTQEQKQIKIAEACGWKWESRIRGAIKVWNKPPLMLFHDNELPDYFNDLNAMHAALKSQTQAFRADSDRLIHAMAEEKHLLITELEAKDWADCFISCLQSQRDSGK